MQSNLLGDSGYEVRVRGRTDAAIWDFICDLVERAPSRVVLRTRSDPTHLIELSPRHVGVKMGERQAGDGTICYLSLDGEYVALATYTEYPKGTLVIPHDYSPTWPYEVSDAEQLRLAQEIDSIRESMMG